MNQNYKQDFSKLKIDNYCRKSSEGEDKQALSIPSQIEEGLEIGRYYNLPKFGEVLHEAKSAKTEYLRPEFARLKKKIDDGKTDAIVCWKLDRLARNMTEGGMIIDYLSSGRLKAVFTKDRIWLPTDNVILMAVDFSQGTQYSKDLSGNVMRGQRTKAKSGTPTGMASLGFLNSKQGEKGTRWWNVDEEKFWKVKKLFELFLTGNYSVRKLHKYAIDELKLTTHKSQKIGGKPVTVTNIYFVLKNPVFAGFFFVQDERYELTKDLPRIITEQQHDKIQQMIANKRKPKFQKHKVIFSGFIQSDTGDVISQDIKYQMYCDCKHKFAYRNKTHCPKCNKAISSFENSKYFIQSYYYNNRKKKAGLEYKSITESKVSEEIVRFVDENLQLPTPILDWSKKYIHELKDKEVSENLNKVYDQEKRKEEFANKKSRLREMLRDLQITDEEYKSDLAKLETSYRDLQQVTKAIDWTKELTDILDLTSCVKEVLESGSFDAKRNILTQLGANLTWNDKELFIDNKKSINTLINGIKTIKPILSEFGNQKALVEQGLSDENTQLCIRLRRR